MEYVKLISYLDLRTIGIDVHKDSYSAFSINTRNVNFNAACISVADSMSVISYIHRIGTPVSIEVGYVRVNKDVIDVKTQAKAVY